MYDAVIIGAGACGLMCGVQAAALGKKVLVLEKNDKVGAKILISGGGRCNYTNLNSTSENFISEDQTFCTDVFNQWTVKDSIDFFESNGIIGKEKVLGQLFPVSNNAKDVVSVFLNLLRKYKAELKLNCSVNGVTKNEDKLFETTYEKDGRKIKVISKSVVMASGGLPISKLGASDFALRTARYFDLKVVNTAPALVPLTITGKDKEWFAALAGNSIFCKVSNDRISFQENILFTHWGLSGPAILQISSYWRAGEDIKIDLLPGLSMTAIISQERNLGGKRLLQHILQEHFTKKFVESLGKFLPIDKKIASLSKIEAKLIDSTIHHFTVKPAGDKGYDKAEVMRGGVSTEELNSKSLESIKVPGLFFGGECVDITGWLGGYNFQWAWASAFVIAKNI
jgi:predicted Rossmann fold flavoprotein